MIWNRGDYLDPEMQKYLKILIKLSILVMGFLALYLLLMYLLPWLGKALAVLPILFLPFILAAILAVLIEPIVNFFEIRLRIQRGLAVVFSLLLVVGGLSVFLFLLITEIARELSGLHPLLTSYSGQITERLVNTVSHLKLLYIQMNLPAAMQTAIQNNLEKIMLLLQNLLNLSINITIKALAMLPSAAVFVLISTVGTFFIVKDRAILRGFLLKVLPAQARTKTRNVFAELFKALTGFIKAYSILISITGVLTMIGLRLMGVEYALTLGIMTGLFDILPILGPGTIFIPWIIWEFAIGRTQMGVGLLLLYVILSVVRQFLEPKIVGDNLGLHPLATLVSLYVGLQLGGFTGMILGPVSVVVIMACYRVGIFDGFNWRKKR